MPTGFKVVGSDKNSKYVMNNVLQRMGQDVEKWCLSDQPYHVQRKETQAEGTLPTSFKGDRLAPSQSESKEPEVPSNMTQEQEGHVQFTLGCIGKERVTWLYLPIRLQGVGLPPEDLADRLL
eukprot:1150539-Pelagomonas_calceolata.AAC.1